MAVRAAARGGAGRRRSELRCAARPRRLRPARAADRRRPTGDLPDNALAGSGLPPLYSIPGAILVGGIALAAVGGTWLRKAGVLALGGAGSCTHGLDSGLPDLRKA